VHQALDAVLDLDEGAVVGEVGDPPEQPRVRRITARDVLPGIFAELLQAERHAVALAVELEHLDLDLVADVDHLGRVLDAAPGHVGDVQQAVDAAEIDEGAVVGQVLDDARQHGALGQVLQQLLALHAVLGLDHGAARHHDVVALAIQLDDLELEHLALEVARVAHRPDVHQRAGQEGAHQLELDGEAALDAAGDHALHDLALLEGLLEHRPGAGALGLLARQAGLAEAVLDGVERNLDLVADADFEFALLVLELLGRDDGLGLQPGGNDDDVVVDLDDLALEDGAGTNLLAGETLLKELCKTF
jgi:hypothetical protein